MKNMLKNVFNQAKNKVLAIILFFVFSKSASGAISSWYGTTRKPEPIATDITGAVISLINWIIGIIVIIFVILLVFSFSASKMNKKEFNAEKEILQNFKRALLFMLFILIIFALYSMVKS